MATSEFVIYLGELSQNLKHGDATEHTHRPALKALLEAIGTDIVATNEPTRILCGAPDFNITRGNVPLGHVETKGIGENLDLMERGKPPYGEQFGRYRDGLPNWILTDYMEFRWYVNGERRLTARLAEVDVKGKLKAKPDGEEAVAELLRAFLLQKALPGLREMVARPQDPQIDLRRSTALAEDRRCPSGDYPTDGRD